MVGAIINRPPTGRAWIDRRDTGQWGMPRPIPDRPSFAPRHWPGWLIVAFLVDVNFQITAVGAGIICWILMFVLIGFLLLPVLVIGVLGLMIYAGVRANDGEAYEYPFAIRLIQ